MGSQGVMLSNDKRWRRMPPSGGFAIDWGHPLTNALAFLWLPGLSDTPQYGSIGATTYGAAQYPNDVGTTWGPGTDARRYASVPASSPLYALKWPASIGVVRRQGDYSGTSYGVGTGLLANATDTSPYVGLDIGVYITGPNQALWWGNGASLGGLTTAPNSGDHVFVGTVRSGGQSLYVDGRRTAGGTSTASNPTMTAPTIALQIDPADLARYLYVTDAMLVFWTRELTANEAAEFSADPFCFLRY